jgi:DNA-binding CsgD family transcriptional regulator
VSQGAEAFVGRAEQLATLDAAWRKVGQGQPATVLIGGEAGMGKSRLAEVFGARVAGAAQVLSGYCLDLSADGLPFAPFTGVLRGLVRDIGADALGALLPGQGARELARLLPELGEPVTAGDPGEARARMFGQVLALLERLAEAGPVVLVIEDAHWSDRSTRDLLAFLVGNQRALRGVLIVVTFRSDELSRGHPLRPVLAELDRLGWVTRLELPRLTRREGRELVAGLLGREPDPELAERVLRRSDGNPLFLEALLAGDGGDGDGGAGAQLPESLRDLVLADVERLPDETQRVLEALAVAGQRSGHELLAAATRLGDWELLTALRLAVSANVLIPDADGYAFRHALIREAILGQVLPGEKTQWHLRLAEVLTADPSLVPPGRAVIEQAHHWYSAHDVPRALASAWQAADAAGRSLAYAERLDMLARVLELWPALPDAAQCIGASHASVLESAVAAALAAGEDDRGMGFAAAALAEIDPAAEPARAGLLLKARGEMRWNLGQAEGIDDLREALPLLPADAAGAAARAQVLGWLAKWEGDSGRAATDEAVEEALRLAQASGDSGAEATALLTLVELHGDYGALPLDTLERARTLAGQAQAYETVLQAAVYESHLLEGAGEHERAAQVARRGLASAQKYGLARGTGIVLAANVAEPLVSLGRWDEAARVIEDGLDQSPAPWIRAALLRLAAAVALARGDLPGAAASAAASGSARPAEGYVDQHHLPLARLEIELALAQGRPGDALAAAGQAVGRFALADSPRYAWPLLAAGAGACAAVVTDPAAARDPGLTDQAGRLLDRLRDLAERMDASGPLQQAHRLTFVAEAARAGSTAETAQPGDGATRAGGDASADGADLQSAWDAAAQAWERLGQSYELARALLHGAEAAMDLGDRDDAAERLARAAALAGQLGARPLGEQIGSLARRARLGLPSVPSRPADDQPAVLRGLTAREAEVLRLVAAGHSNRDIAAELFISAKTVSVHVSNILAKLDATSRTEAAAIAHRAGLADDS